MDNYRFKDIQERSISSEDCNAALSIADIVIITVSLTEKNKRLSRYRISKELKSDALLDNVF